MKYFHTRQVCSVLSLIRRVLSNPGFVLIMRVSLLNVLLLTGTLEVLLANAVHSQELDKIHIDIELKNESLPATFRKIESQTGLLFAYPNTHIKAYPTVTLARGTYSVKQVLDKTLEGTPFRYWQKENHVIIFDEEGEKNGNSSKPEEVDIHLELRNQVTVNGIVVDASTQSPLPGVNILIKGTTVGTSSDASGKFSIGVSESDVLIFSFIGFKPIEEPVAGRSSINIAMETDVQALEEVVVHAGYYDVSDREKTGNISKIKAEVIANQPVTNPLQTLQGRMPGIYINQNTGLPGSNFQVRIRGTNSIANGNDPLYVIDGIPFISRSLSDENTSGNLYPSQFANATGVSPLNSINPNDIESIEVLKDADATAIYGSRGANGVILITTKKGKAGVVKLNVNLKTGISKVTQRVSLLNTQQYLAMRMEAVHNDGDIAPKPYEYDINGTWDQNRYTDWQDVLIGGTAKMTDLNVSLSGGSKDTQFLFGTGYNNQGTVFPGTNSAGRFSTHFSVTHASLDKKIDTKFSISYGVAQSNLLSSDLTSLALSIPPNAPRLYDNNGKLNWENSTWGNPLAPLGNRFNSNTYNLLANAQFGYTIIKGLRIGTNIGFNDTRNEERRTNSSNTQDPADHPTPATSTLLVAGATNRSLIIEPQMNWETKIGQGKLLILTGGTYQRRTDESSRNDYTGFSSNALIDNPKAASSAILAYYNFAEYRYAALYGRINYNWDGKYILNLTGRRDGSSRFGPGKKFANLGAIGLAWVFSNEDLIKNNHPLLSFGKLRASYGLTGNDQIGDYRYLDNYGPSLPYGGIPSLGPAGLFNPDYSWEVNKKLEGAIELGFLNDRILFSSAYYLNRSSNQLINYQLAGTTGYSSILLNSPATVQNTGLEMELNTINVHKKNFKWTTSVNITFPKNKLVSFPHLESSSYANFYIIGKPLSISKAYHYLGVNPTTGIYEVEDINHDGKITIDDRQSLIVRSQQYYGGVNNSFQFKGIQVDIFIQFVKQDAKRNVPYRLPGSFNSLGIINGNQQATVLSGRWTKTGDIATSQYFSRDEAMQNSQNLYYSSDGTAMRVMFARLKNISISYQIPHRLLGRISGRVYAQGQNLLTITNYDGLDPETGPDSLPPLTTIVGGLQFDF